MAFDVWADKVGSHKTMIDAVSYTHLDVSKRQPYAFLCPAGREVFLLTALLWLMATLLDHGWGEPHRWHPLVGFGGLANRVESLAYGPPQALSLIHI